MVTWHRVLGQLGAVPLEEVVWTSGSRIVVGKSLAACKRDATTHGDGAMACNTVVTTGLRLRSRSMVSATSLTDVRFQWFLVGQQPPRH